ncbi:hypothetical protein JCM11641_003897 [Rhodosporidiobolus odoratus]
MAKGSGRFRNRKLGFKTRIAVEIGVVLEEDPLDATLEVEDEKGRKGVETGVDKDEEGEVHLQAVIASTAAYVSRATGPADKGKKAAQAYIPTRTSTEIPEAEFRALYTSGYVDPFSYIRFSDTVEDCFKGAAGYTMDEDDEDWLEDYNAQFTAGSQPIVSRSSPVGGDGESSARGARAKGKGVAGGEDLPAPTAPLSEDNFEFVMEVFEHITDQKAPMAHVDVNLLPSLLDFDDAFDDELKPQLAKLRPYAKDVYPHWRERRVARGGKPVIPALDYDESNEQNPYVCFRRREPKTSRKTRRSDQQNLERLIRLRNDLFAAHALMIKVQERERMKLDALLLEKKVFEERCEMRALKRRLNEPDGDEDLLISRKEKRRRREDQSTGSLRLSIRKPDPSNLSTAALVPSIEELQARKQRNDGLLKQIDRDITKKRQADQHWEDWTDTAYIARAPPTPARYWRSVEAVPHSTPFNATAQKKETLGFATTYQPPLGRVRPSFRKRIGRGGRVLLDRISIGGNGAAGRGKRRLLPLAEGTDDEPSDAAEEEEEEEEEEEDDWLSTRRQERFRYDTDAGLDFPTADDPVLLDDYELPYLLRRAALLKHGDLDSLTVDSSYLDEAFRFVASDPDKNAPAPQVVGRPPPRPALQMAPSAAAAATASPAVQQAATAQAPNAAAYAQAQQQLAAQQAMRLAQQQAAIRKSQGSPSNGTGVAQSPLGMGQQLPLPPSMQNGAGSSPIAQFHPSLPSPYPHQQGSPHGVANGLPLPPSSLPQQQPRPNGLPAVSPQPPHMQLINGANGLPATSRLSAPPYSSNPALQAACHAQQQQQLAAVVAANGGTPAALQQLQAAAVAGRPLSAGGLPQPTHSVHPPSRPTSAASHHSPHLAGNLALPPPGASPTALRLNGLGANLGTPPPNAAQGVKRSSPMAQVQLGPGGYAALPPQIQQQLAQKAQQGSFGGFVQG